MLFIVSTDVFEKPWIKCVLCGFTISNVREGIQKKEKKQKKQNHK